METAKCRSIPTAGNKSSSKLARTFQKVINLKTATTKVSSNNGIGICILTHPNKLSDDHHHPKDAKIDPKRGAVLEALLAKLFAEVTAIKAAYAELQMAQNPYSTEAIQAADQLVVDELKTLSDLKRSFVKNELDFISPQVTVMLAEIQEQQSLMKTYQITIQKLEAEADSKSFEAESMKKLLDEYTDFNRSLEKKLNASGPLPMFDNIQLSVLNPSHFVSCLHYAIRSMRSFAKLMIREMESAHWDMDAAAAAIEPKLGFPISKTNRGFVFESFVSKTMFEGFNHLNFTVLNDSATEENDNENNHRRRENCFSKFKKMKAVNLRHYLTQNPNSSFAKFTRGKYSQLVHAKMECSLFGNLNQRKAVTSGAFPDTAFFSAFAEMARRVWVLNLLALSFGEQLHIFQVRKNCRFSEVYMESVSEDGGVQTSGGGGDVRVGFTVVPGFKIGKTVVQSQVYLTPAGKSPVRR
ncbi:Protein GRAVITROPIC IN THE LIGHT 1 [Linum grandiflorum]